MYFDSRSVRERFFSKVAVGSLDECWLWQESTDQDGYGLFWVRAGELDVPLDARTARGQRGKQRRAHRVAFYLEHGRWPQPRGLHGCDNPPCCNAVSPKHVHEGTSSQNSLEMFERARQPARMRGGEQHYNAVLANAQVAELCRRYDHGNGGVSQRQLAAEYGVSQISVSRYVRGVRYSA